MADHNLPRDIIPEILSNLPVKPLMRFKCVSKPWNSLISHPDFIKRHLDRATQNNKPNLMLTSCGLKTIDYDSSFNKAVEIDYPLKSPNYGVDVLGSCHGLVCIALDEDIVCIWNPCTKEFKQLPTTPIDFPKTVVLNYRTILQGFGYDSIIDDYKVVRIVMFYGDQNRTFYSEVKVYSLRTNSWRRIQVIPYYIVYKRLPGVLTNGALHWVAAKDDPYTPDSNGEYESEPEFETLIAAFDIVKEEFKVVPQPDYPDDVFHIIVGVLGGRLCVLCNFYEVCVDVWVMQRYGVKDSWTKQFIFTQSALIRSFEYVRPVMFFKTGELLLVKDDKEFLLYDQQHEKTRTLKICGLSDWFETATFIGSLVSLDSGTYVGQEKAIGSRKGKKKKKKKSGKKSYAYDLAF